MLMLLRIISLFSAALRNSRNDFTGVLSCKANENIRIGDLLQNFEFLAFGGYDTDISRLQNNKNEATGIAHGPFFFRQKNGFKIRCVSGVLRLFRSVAENKEQIRNSISN